MYSTNCSSVEYHSSWEYLSCCSSYHFGELIYVQLEGPQHHSQSHSQRPSCCFSWLLWLPERLNQAHPRDHLRCHWEHCARYLSTACRIGHLLDQSIAQNSTYGQGLEPFNPELVRPTSTCQRSICFQVSDFLMIFGSHGQLCHRGASTWYRPGSWEDVGDYHASYSASADSMAEHQVGVRNEAKLMD